MTKRLLLDINALLALGWANHPFHRAVRERLLQVACPWATCAMVQLGFLRLSMNPAAVAPNAAASGTQAHALLKQLVSDRERQYLDTAPAPAETPSFSKALGHNQINDLQLIEIARANECMLLSADKGLIQHYPSLVEALRL